MNCLLDLQSVMQGINQLLTLEQCSNQLFLNSLHCESYRNQRIYLFKPIQYSSTSFNNGLSALWNPILLGMILSQLHNVVVSKKLYQGTKNFNRALYRKPIWPCDILESYNLFILTSVYNCRF